ncbi:O-acetyl-ADP-ribose deacetylase macrod1 [Mortierella sp. GBA30]|nr:O-acetyl-ADP-ribose deacetylase macrod1 [Mortierella sp. GBA30]
MSDKKLVTVEDIPNLEECYVNYPEPTEEYRNANVKWNKKISLWHGDITSLKIDAVVNAANESLLGGGGIDGAIHRAAGRELLAECRKLGGCPTGEAKITKGYNLPSRHVIHTVGPIGEIPGSLKSCYQRVLDVAQQSGIKTVMSRIIFCTFLDKDKKIYEDLLPAYFPKGSAAPSIANDTSPLKQDGSLKDALPSVVV